MRARDFLATREPAPPEALARWLDGTALDAAEPLDALARAGLQALDAARAEPGRVRSSAFHLLAADALLTYACEAALEAEDPASALDDLLRRAAETR